MNKDFLVVGDPHVTPSNLEDSERLMEFVYSNLKVDSWLVILGDLFHTKEVIRGSVLSFWTKWLNKFSEKTTRVFVLVGNHDQFYLGKQEEHSLISIKSIDGVTVVDTPYCTEGVSFMPYIHNSEAFTKSANDLASFAGNSILFCHQTFAGSRFENGFFAPDGVNPDLVNYKKIISGHIHSAQSFGKIIYPGTPMWHTASDANQNKGIAKFQLTSDGEIISYEVLDTSAVVTPIYDHLITPDNESVELKPGKNFITMEGPSSWIKEKSKELKGKAFLRGKPTDSKIKKTKIALKHSTISSFLDNFSLSDKVSKEDILKYIDGLENERS